MALSSSSCSSAIAAPSFASPSLLRPSPTSSHGPSFLNFQTSQVLKTFPTWSGFRPDFLSSFSVTKESNKGDTCLRKFGHSIRAAAVTAPPRKKRWEKIQVKPNSLPVVRKMHVKVGDSVKIIAGSDKGKVSEVTRIYSHDSNVLIKNVNLKTKHVKGKAEGESGQIIQVEAPIHSSNVMLYSKTEKVASRVGHKVLEDGKKVRYLLKTGELLDSSEDWKRLHKKENKDEKKSLSIV